MKKMRAPSGSLRFHTTQHVDASARELAGLATDLPRLKLMDARIRTAEWLDGDAAAGGTAFVALSVTFAHEWVHRAVGRQQATVRLGRLESARGVEYLARSDQGEAFLLATFADQKAGCSVRITGWMVPRRPPIRRGLRLLRPLVARLTTRSIRRALVRAEVFLHAR
jgi:hypothetical protein